MIFSPNEGREATTTEQAIIASIDAAMLSKNKAQTRRQYLGASRIGHHCERALGYEYHMVEKDEGADFKGKTLRIFDMGHDGEERVADYLKLAGFELQTHAPDGKQIGMSDAGGKFKGHLDGVIHSGPVDGLKYPMLWENKALGDKSWSEQAGVLRPGPDLHGVPRARDLHVHLSQPRHRRDVRRDRTPRRARRPGLHRPRRADR